MFQLKLTTALSTLLLLVTCLAGSPCMAESGPFSPAPYTRVLTSLGDINIGEVNVIFQSSDGYLWIGTHEGLIRYDGINAKRYANEPDNPDSLPHNRIFGIAQDAKGFLWLASYGGGLIKFDRQHERFTPIDLRTDAGQKPPTPLLYRLVIDDQGKLWIGSNERLMLYDTVTQKPLPLPKELAGLPDKLITMVTIDHKGRKWFSTDFDGLFVYDGKTLRQFTSDGPVGQRLIDNRIRCVVIGNDGTVWVGTQAGLQRYDEASDSLSQLFPSSNPELTTWHDDIFALKQDNKGLIWLGSGQRGISTYNPKTGHFQPISGKYDRQGHFKPSRVNDIFKDSSGSLWFATSQGLVYIPKKAQRFDYITDDSNDFRITDIDRADDGRELFIAGFNLYELAPASFTATTLVKDDRMLYRLDSDDSNHWWIATFGNGLQQYSNETNRLLPFDDSRSPLKNNKVRQIMEVTTVGKDVWLLGIESPPESYGGIAHVGHNDGQMRWDSKTTELGGILPLNDELFLLASWHKGLYGFNPQNKQVTHWGSHKVKAPKQVAALYQDSLKRVWIGTLNEGLAKYDVDHDTFTYYTVADGLLSNNIDSIIEDNDHNLWLGTTVGLSRLNPQTRTVLNIEKQDGLLFSHFYRRASFKQPDGNILLGTRSGLVRLNPDDFKRHELPPTAIITDFRLFNRPVALSSDGKPSVLDKTIEYTDKVVLSAEDYIFSFGFSAVEFQRPKKVRYAYRMVGLDDQWVYTDSNNRTASYTTLSAGDYRFEVKAGIKDGPWSTQTAQINVTVLPPWYLTWQAYLGYLLLLLGSIYLYIRVHTAKLTREAKLLESKVAQRTAELEKSRDELARQTQTVSELLTQKQRLFASMSHEFRTPLTLILSPLDQLLKRLGDNPIAADLSLIRRNGRRLLRMVDQLLEFAKLEQHNHDEPEAVSLAQTVGLVEASFDNLVKSKDMTLLVKPCPDVNLMMLPDSLNKILINLLSNAFKYTPKGGHIEVAFERRTDSITIFVKDNGIGIAEKDQQVIFERFNRATEAHGESIVGAGIGLALVKELIEANHGEIRLDSAPGRGSTFIVTLPLTDRQPQQPKTAEPSALVSELLSLEVDSAAQPAGGALSKENQPIEDGQRQSILIIDDNADMRNLLTSALGDQYDCLEADNGETGLRISLEQVPDLIISDIMMPVMDGYELARRLKEQMLTCHIPIVLLTAKGSVESRLKGLQLLVDDYLPKPFNVDELKLRVHNILTIRTIVAKRGAQSLDSSDGTLAYATADNAELENVFVERLNRQLADNYNDAEFNAKRLSEQMSLSERQLHRKIKAMFDTTIPELVRNFRLKKATELLQAGNRASQVYFNVGFSSHSYFSSCFKAKFGMTPKEFQKAK